MIWRATARARLATAGTAAAVTLLAARAAASGAATALPPAWAAWKASAPLVVAAESKQRGGGYVRVVLPPQIDPGRADDYADLRVVDDAGTERPYAIDPGVVTGDDAGPLPLTDTGFVRGAYSQAVADAGSTGVELDAVTIATSRATFFVRATIEASDDRVAWRELGGDTTLYRVAERGDAGNQTIVFPPTRSRWLRVRIDDAHAPFPIDGVRVARAARAPAALRALPASLVRMTHEAAGRQRFVFDLGSPRVAVEAVRFDGASGTFSRAVSVESSDDAKTWRAAGDGRIERFAEGDAQLGFAFEETHGRYARITVANGDDAPLAGLRPTLFTRPRVLVFEAEAGHSYALAFQNAHASAPLYDLGTRLARERWSARATAVVGRARYDTSASPDTRSPFERYAWIVNAAFAIVGLGLAILAMQTLRGAQRDA